MTLQRPTPTFFSLLVWPSFMTPFAFQSKPWLQGCIALLLVFCAALPTAVQAARPLNTDDAKAMTILDEVLAAAS